MDLEGGAGADGRLAQWAAVGVLARTFPVELVDRVIDQYWRREQRTRALPTRLVFYFVLVLCLFPQESYRSALKILLGAFGRPAGERRVPAVGAIVKARRRLGPEPVETIVRAVMQPAADRETRGAWYRDWRLAAFDGTTFTVPDSDENDREFGRPGSGRGEGKTAYPQVQAACLIELGTHAVFDARLDEYAAAETMLIEEMFSALQPGMLVLADRNVYSFHRWRRAAATGADLLWRVPSNLTLRPVKHLPDGSYIAEVIPPAKSGMVSFRVRVIEYKLTDVQDGKDELYRLVTTILDPEQAPAKELAMLYHERWDVEGFFKQIKSVQLNPARIFRSKSPDGVRQEFWAHLAVHYATTRIIVDAAHHADLDPTAYPTRTPSASSGPESGFRILSPLSGHDDHYQRLIREVAGEVNPPRRDRSYPRVIKRKMSNFAVKRPHHRQRHRHSRPPHTAVTITPPSKTGRSPRPARST